MTATDDVPMDVAPTPAARGDAAGGRSRAGAYALWQLRDYMINKGFATMLIAGLFLFITWSSVRRSPKRFGDFDAVMGPEMVNMMLSSFVTQILLFGVLFATNGIVSEDRKLGYYRFIFAKPVSTAQFYGQKFAVHLGGLMAVFAVMLGIFSFVFAPRFEPSYLPVLLMLAIGLGGIGFLLSAVFTLDWLTLLTVYFASLVAWSLWGEAGGLHGMLVRALPPVHRLGSIIDAMVQGRRVPEEPLWWIFVYGLVCFVLGLVVVSRRRLATT